MNSNKNKKNKVFQSIVLFFLILSTFPTFLERLLSVENQIDSSMFHIISWIIFIGLFLILAVIVISKKTLPAFIFKVLLSIAAGWFVLLVLMGADRLYGRWNVSNNHTAEITALYPPNTTVHYQSFEMDFMLKVNKYGFRGSHSTVPEKKKDLVRIACIGDSFTMGWGVEEEQSWPFLLETFLNNEEIEAEVLNWGKGGNQPEDYLAVCKKMIPEWKPDLVIVSFFQLDDLFQLSLSEGLINLKYSQRANNPFINLAYRLFPNTWERVNAIPFDDRIDPMWKEQANRIQRNWPESALNYYSSLPDSVKQYFMNGELNPWIMDMNMRYPNWTDSLYHVDQSELIAALSNKIDSIQYIARLYDAQVLFQQIPFRGLISEWDRRHLASAGLDFDQIKAEEFQADVDLSLSNKNISIVTHNHCMTEMGDSLNEKLYLDLDGHLNEMGNRVLLDCMYPFLKYKMGIYNY